MSTNGKVAKKGEFIFKEGDKISSLILIQSGTASLCISRPKKNIEIHSLVQGQIAGEIGLSGATTHPLALFATTDVKYMEIPIDPSRAQIEAAPQFLKMVTKSLVERLKIAMNELRSYSMEKDQTPCPEEIVARVFGVLFHTAKRKGRNEDKKNPDALTMDWVSFKQYAQRVFGESPRRLEQACNILVKLKMASYLMGKPDDNPEGADEIKEVTFTNLNFVEIFFEFYQHYYFKGAVGTYLKFDETCFSNLQLILKAVEGIEPDRNSVVSINFAQLIAFFKNEAGLNLTPAQFTQLEGRGLFSRRIVRSADDQVILSFDLREWRNTLEIWKILCEIEKWNEKGFVDLNEAPGKPKKKGPEGPTCSSCRAEVTATAKFCPECGAKLSPLAAVS